MNWNASSYLDVGKGHGLKYLKLTYSDEFSRSYEKFSWTCGQVKFPRRFIILIHLFETSIHPRFSAKKERKNWLSCSSTQTLESFCLKHDIILNWCIVVFGLVLISFFHPWWFYSTQYMYLAGSYIILIDFVCSTCNLNAVIPKFVIYLLISTLSNISENFRALARHLLLLLRSTLLVTVVSNSRIIRMSACVSLGCGGCWTFPGWCHGRLFLPAAAWWTARQTSLAHWRQHPWQPGVCVCVCVCVSERDVLVFHNW